MNLKKKKKKWGGHEDLAAHLIRLDFVVLKLTDFGEELDMRLLCLGPHLERITAINPPHPPPNQCHQLVPHVTE